MSPPRVVLFGPPGALTGEVAAALAVLLGAPLLDTDVLIAQDTGRDTADIFIQDGEAAYRDLERDAAARALATPGAVVALGGGAPLDETTAGLLTEVAAAGTPVVELGVTVAHAARRLGLTLGVPTGLINARAQWLRQHAAREPHYARLRTHLVPTDDATPDEIARQVADLATVEPPGTTEPHSG